MNLEAILWNNEGQRLTPELIVGILQGAAYVPANYIDFSAIEPLVYGDYVFHAERFATAVEELKPLHTAHWLETEKHRHGLHLAYDYPGFEALDRAGRLVLFTVRRGGELVGQCAQKLGTSMHTGTLFADEDSLFLRADCRGGWTAKRFIAYMEAGLQTLGVVEVRASTKLVNTAGKLLELCGFARVANQYVKMLGGGYAQTET